MLKVGDIVRWMCPLDHDYFYGVAVNIRNQFVTIKGIGLYKHITVEVHSKYIEKVKVAGGRNCGSGKRDSKLLPTKGKL